MDRNPVAFNLVDNVFVALRKESVDRNTTLRLVILKLLSRSPQGERG